MDQKQYQLLRRSHSDKLDFYVIYDHPPDYPSGFVMRRQSLIMPECIIVMADDVYAAYGRTATAVRDAIPSEATQIQWPGDDPDPIIIEVWMI